jgi:hypothetical protein
MGKFTDFFNACRSAGSVPQRPAVHRVRRNGLIDPVRTDGGSDQISSDRVALESVGSPSPRRHDDLESELSHSGQEMGAKGRLVDLRPAAPIGSIARSIETSIKPVRKGFDVRVRSVGPEIFPARRSSARRNERAVGGA